LNFTSLVSDAVVDSTTCQQAYKWLIIDFQVEHKIQSSDGPPNVPLQLVPKMLKPLVFEWTPQAFIVSFKVVERHFRSLVLGKLNMQT